MTNMQSTLTILLPALAAICGFVTALVGVYVDKGRFDRVDARLDGMTARLVSLTKALPVLGERFSHFEGSLGGR